MLFTALDSKHRVILITIQVANLSVIIYHTAGTPECHSHILFFFFFLSPLAPCLVNSGLPYGGNAFTGCTVLTFLHSRIKDGRVPDLRGPISALDPHRHNMG
ncbi:hypothetical protein F4801DRAFT_220747 [Xylaria longipes]|nr:hypothetical protein F4801DRAFT_220747 [Xylaria longipes]